MSMDSDGPVLLVALAIGVACVWGCFALAQSKGYNTGLAIVFGILFGLIALIVYAVLPRKVFPPSGPATYVAPVAPAAPPASPPPTPPPPPPPMPPAP